MNVHALHPNRARCDHGHFLAAGSDACRRCGAPETGPTTEQQAPAGRVGTKRPRLSLVKAPRVPALALVTAIPATIPLTVATDASPGGPTATGSSAAAATDLAADASSTTAAPAASGASTSAQRPQEPAGQDSGGDAPALPVRPVQHAETPLPAAEVAAARAAISARATGLHTEARVMDWRGYRDGTATNLLDDGTRLRYQPDQRCLFAAAVPCLFGAHHYASIRGRVDLEGLRVDANTCFELHADLTQWPTAAAKDLAAAFTPRLVPAITPVLPLQRKEASTDGR